MPHAAAQAAGADDGRARFLATYKELVETNTTLSAGDCTLAAQRMRARLQAAGYPDADLRLFVPDGHPKEGGLVAVLHGSDPTAKAILMLAHVDVVEAQREDWTRDPFTLIEEGGYFYGRGTSDMKAQAAIWVDNLVRFREEGFHPQRTIKLALTCGEETSGALNGAQWLDRARPRRHRCRLRAHRGRRRRPGCPRPARRTRRAGGREGLAELHLRGDQPGRPQLASRAGQRDLSPGARRWSA